MAKGVLLQPEEARKIAETVNYVDSLRRSQAGATVLYGRGSVTEHGTIAVLNNGSEDLDVFSIVRITRNGTVTTQGVIATPTEVTKATYYWTATPPDEEVTGTYAVLITPAYKKRMGMAMMSGVTRVRLDDSDTDAESEDPSPNNFANPQAGDTIRMKTAGLGMFPVLSVEDKGEAETWGYVLMGGSTQSLVRPGVVRVVTAQWPHNHRYAGTWLDVMPTQAADFDSGVDPTDENVWEWHHLTTLQSYGGAQFHAPLLEGDIVGVLFASYQEDGTLYSDAPRPVGLLNGIESLFTDCACPP